MSARAVALLAFAAACANSPPAPPSPDASAGLPVGTGARVDQMIGAQGGTITLEGVTLTIPAGALQDTQAISLLSTRELPPVGFVNRSPLYRFLPQGLTFNVPATVSIPVAGDPSNVHMFWSNAAPALGFVDARATRAGSALTAHVTHFSDAVNAEGCPPQLPSNCKGVCVDFETDPVNCGDCGFPALGCGVKEVCYHGRCKQLCFEPALLFCGEVPCHDARNDLVNCGGCGHSCLPGRSCSMGKCVPCATVGLVDCDGLCVNLQNNAFNCGACNNDCPFRADVVCLQGKCRCDFGFTQCGTLGDPGACVRGPCPAADGGVDSGTPCMGSMISCKGSCVDPATSIDHCGKCGNHCRFGPCVAGACTYACGTKQIYCSGACVDAYSDKINCGRCSGEGGTCLGKTPGCCGGSCVDFDSNPYNCGGCGADCSQSLGPGAVAACCGGQCVDLRVGRLSNGDYTNCGKCGTHCTAPPLTQPLCCHGQCVDGTADPLHCGSCTQTCYSWQTCQPGTSTGVCRP